MVKRRNCQEQLVTRTRIFSLVFGVVWLVDAIFKWLPGFFSQFSGYVHDAMVGQPNLIMPWFMFWVHFVRVDPVLIATIIALLETMIALSLLLGVARKPMYIIGALVSVGIWSVAEGFGGPYASGATDIGAAIMYVFVFAGLWGLEQFSAPYTKWTLDTVIAKKWAPWARIGIWEPISEREEVVESRSNNYPQIPTATL